MLQPWYVRENKWRAARYGMDAEIITDVAGSERLVGDDLRDLLTTLVPVAERLGCAAELQQVRVMLDGGASYQRQLRVAEAAGGDLTAVVAHLARELRDGVTPRPRPTARRHRRPSGTLPDRDPGLSAATGRGSDYAGIARVRMSSAYHFALSFGSRSSVS